MDLHLRKESSVIGSHVLLIIFLVVSIISIALYSSEDENGALHVTQNGFSSLATPFKIVGAGVGSVTNAASTSLEDVSADADTLNELKTQNEELRSMVSSLEEYRQEAQRLQSLQKLKDTYSLDSVTAHVIGKSTDAWSRVITIDKGTADGVKVGLPVVGTSGVIGQVKSATANTADVKLLQDPESGVAVLIQSNRVEGIVKGNLDGLLYLEDVDTDATVSVGDVVVTSGVGGSYFKGLIVGTVVKVEQSQGQSTREIVVSPNDSATALEEVMVVTAMNSDGAAATTSTSTSTSTSASTGGAQ